MAKKQNLEERFWRQVNKDGPTMPHMTTPCWIWVGGMFTDGYGKIKVDGKTWKAHRLSYLLHYKVHPSKLSVCHTCDNPSCVNPGHLWLGTPGDNMRDRNRKGRTARGSATGVRKLTSRQVREIRKKLQQELTHESIAVEYGVCATTITMIATGETWGWLDGGFNFSAEKAKAIRQEIEQRKAKALELRQAGLSYSQIGKILNRSETTIYRLLKSNEPKKIFRR